MVPTNLEQHADQASFLWRLRDRAVHSRTRSRGHVARLDRRIESHLDGLRQKPSQALDVVRQTLRFDTPGHLFTLTEVAVHTGDKRAFAKALDIAGKAPALARGVVSAMGWAPEPMVTSLARALVRADSPLLKRLGLASYRVKRIDPGTCSGT